MKQFDSYNPKQQKLKSCTHFPIQIVYYIESNYFLPCMQKRYCSKGVSGNNKYAGMEYEDVVRQYADDITRLCDVWTQNGEAATKFMPLITRVELPRFSLIIKMA